MTKLMKSHPLLSIVNSSLVDLPSPSNLSFMWNFGSLLGLSLGVQIVTGLFLAMNFSASTEISFVSVVHISQDVELGWFIRMIHANGASMFFLFLYLHVARGIYYGSYTSKMTWSVGVILLLLVMAAAFLGYVLPWGQMSFWGATVITSLFSAIPYIGEDIVVWLWGGFAVDNATLTRFFSLHFILPLVVLGGVMVHLLFLHEKGSNNPLGSSSDNDKISFHPYFSVKDLLGVSFSLLGLMYICCFFPWTLGDPENFISANPMVTPIHIQPEWYFLFAYAILRSIPNKLGGVVALGLAVVILLIMPFQPKTKFCGLVFYSTVKIYFWFWVNSIFLLTWIGARPVEEPYILTGQVLTIFYFSYYFFSGLIMSWFDKML